LFDYATGRLPPGAALTVAAHLEHCPHCTEEVGFLESVGGALLETADPEPLPANALDRALAAIDALPQTPKPNPAHPDLPRALAGRRIGKWRWAGPGVRMAWIPGAAGPGERLYLLHVQPGVSLPQHGHHGAERLIVLRGEFTDGDERFGPGDLQECDEQHLHRPVVSPHGDCLCLAATDGPLRLSGVARWLQPLLGI